MPANGPCSEINYQKWQILTSIKIERTVITHGRLLLKANELCSTNELNFLSLFQISSFNSFGDMRLTKIGLLRKCQKFLQLGYISRSLSSIDMLTCYQWYSWKFSMTIIKDLYTNKVNLPNEKIFTRFACPYKNLFSSLVTITICVFLC